jgi:hypothetical protein
VPPAPPRRPDTGYFTAATPLPQQDNGRRNLVIAGIVVGLVALLVIGGVGAYALLHNKKPTGNNPGGNGVVATTQGGQATQTNPDLVDLQCTTLVGKNAQNVEEQLRQQGFTVKRVNVMTISTDEGRLTL